MMKNEKALKGSVGSVSHYPGRYRGNNYGLYRLLGIVGIMIMLSLLVLIGAQYIQYYETQRELVSFEERILEHERRQTEAMLEIEHLQDPNYIEILARSRLGLVKPGEVIFQLDD